MAHKRFVSEKMRLVPREFVHALRTQRKSRGAITDEEMMKLAEHYESYRPDPLGDPLVGRRRSDAYPAKWKGMDPEVRAGYERMARDFYHSYGPGEYSWPGERHPAHPEEPIGTYKGRWMLQAAPKRLSPKKRKMLADYREVIAEAAMLGRPRFYTRTRRTR